MSEMVERVARAVAHLRMCELQGNIVPCASCSNARGHNDDVGCMTLARAVIEAMREPTEAMRIAALTTGLPEVGDPPLYEMVWRAMLDGATAR